MKPADPRFIACRAPHPDARIVLFGIPFEGTVNLRTGADHGPRDLRVASDSIETYSPFLERDLDDLGIADLGDCELGTGSPRAQLDRARDEIRAFWRPRLRPVMLGGDHTATLPVIEVLAPAIAVLEIVGGLCFILGVWTRPFALLFIMMLMNDVYARAFAVEILPGLLERAPTARPPAALGASLGGLAFLHAHWLYPGLLGGLFLQSGSFFRRRFDRQEAGFPRFDRISRFVGRVLAGPDRGAPLPVPVTITCGAAEENLDNNRAVAAALDGAGYPLEYVEHPDAHNWISWRDVLHPHLAELLLRAWQ